MIHHEEPGAAGYDPKIIRRILEYVKPYWLLVTLSILFILLATGGQLLLPVIIQRAVDEDLRPSWMRAEIEDRESLLAYDSRLEQELVLEGSALYGPENSIGPWLRSRERDAALYFLIPLEEISLTAAQFEGLGQQADILGGEEFLVIEESEYARLDQDLKRGLRIQDWEAVGRKGLYYFMLLLVVLVSSFLQIYLLALAGQHVMRDLRMDLYRRTVSQNLRFLQNQQVGRLVTRVSSDVETINELFTNVLSAIISDVVMMAGVLITLFFLNVRLGTYALAVIPPVTVLLILFRNRAREAYRKVRTWVSSVNAYLSEHFSGVQLVQAFVQENRVLKEFRERNQNLFKANVGELYVFTIFRPLVDLLATLSIALILYTGASSLLQGLVSLGVLIAFINLIQRFYEPVMDMAEKFTLIQSAMAGSERVFALLDENSSEIPASPGTEGEGPASFDRNQVRGSIEFSDVHFSYNQGEPVLRGISFRCEPGERVALVGYTGSGKTTIANVMTRLWEIESGSISLDGRDVRDISLDDLRTTIQPIQQDLSLFHMTVRDNLLLGKSLTDPQIFAILDEVEAGEFIRALPQGLDTMVSENAENFSSGQLQLLSFARLLIQDPRVVIMDEATANIDTRTEKLIQHAMDRILEGRTSFIIAHRLSTIMDADRILVLDKGRVLQSGTHAQLIAVDGLYKSLYELQFSRTG